jgi:hypothetical protein
MSKTMVGKCAHEDSRISCIECSSPLCSNCLVQCPVGFRCKSCVGSVKTAVKTARSMGVVGTLGLAVATGCAGGWIMPMINIPFLSCVIAFLMGLAAGKGMAKVIDERMPKLGTTVVFGLLIGLSLSPYNMLPLVIFETLRASVTGEGMGIFFALNMIVNMLFSPVCFIVGVLRPTIWRHHW